MNAVEAQRELEASVAEETSKPAAKLTEYWVDHFRAMPGVAAILFYGSGLNNTRPDGDVVYDFYLLVHRYRDYAPGWALAAAGSLVPPNVYYFESPVDFDRGRCKVAVLTISQFCAATEEKSFTPHIWARFCQPCRILFAEDKSLRSKLNRALSNCVTTFHRRTLHLIDSCPVADFWSTGLRVTYADEIRSERSNRARTIYAANAETFRERTVLALQGLPEMGWLDEKGIVHSKIPSDQRRLHRLRHRLTRPLRKAVVVLRLIKAAFSFSGGLDYARWKVERHSGVRIELTDFQRRHPVLGGLVLYLKAARLGALK